MKVKVITKQMVKTRKIRKVIEMERNAPTIRDSRWSTRRKEKMYKLTRPLPSKVEQKHWYTKRKTLKQMMLRRSVLMIKAMPMMKAMGRSMMLRMLVKMQVMQRRIKKITKSSKMKMSS